MNLDMKTATAPASNESSVITFEEGIIGVPRARRFELLEQDSSPVRLLRSLDIPHFALPVVDPALADPGYRPGFGSRLNGVLEVDEGDPVLVLAVATLESGGPLANLRAPVVINARTRRAVQLILEDRSYPLRAPVRVEGQDAEPALPGPRPIRDQDGPAGRTGGPHAGSESQAR